MKTPEKLADEIMEFFASGVVDISSEHERVARVARVAIIEELKAFGALAYHEGWCDSCEFDAKKTPSKARGSEGGS